MCVLSNFELTQVLIDLGLTHSQAKVYSALSQSRTSTVKNISRISQVAREHVYEVLPQLQNLGLVEKIIDAPSMFCAIPIQEGLSILFQNRTLKTHELQKKFEKIKCINHNFEMLAWEEGNQFILIPPKKAALNRRKREIEAAQTSIDILVSTMRLGPTAHIYYEAFKNALERGAKIRVITEKPEDTKEIPKIIQDFIKNPSFQLRYILNPPSAIVTIFDGNRILVTTSANAGLGESPAFWSNNPCLLAMINDFYEIMWITAIENHYAELIQQ
jgi:sugar-specific transcriptional regulator TrmB